jgi:hypothetical protein
MVSAQCLVRGGVVGASPGGRSHTVVLTIQDDGVSIFDINKKVCIFSTHYDLNIMHAFHICNDMLLHP